MEPIDPSHALEYRWALFSEKVAEFQAIMVAKTYEIAVLKGDGVGIEVVDHTLRVLNELMLSDGSKMQFTEYPCGARCYLEQGDPLPASTLQACGRRMRCSSVPWGCPRYAGRTEPR